MTNRCIGAGGYGAVHVALDRKQKKQVACKIINLKAIRERIQCLQQDQSQENDQPEILKQKMEVYEREALVLQHLDHVSAMYLLFLNDPGWSG